MIQPKEKYAIRQWYADEFARRTRALATGHAKIEWLDPGTRVSFCEVAARAEHLGITSNVIELRELFK